MSKNINTEVAQESLEDLAQNKDKQIKKLEKELRREKKNVKRAEELEKGIIAQKKELDEIIDLYMIYLRVDNDLKIVEASKAVSQIIGYSKEEIVGKKITEFIEAKSMEKFIQGCEYVSTHGKEAWGSDIIFQDMHFVDIATRTFIHPSFEAGKLTGFLIVLKDIRNDILLHELRRKFVAIQKHDETIFDFFTNTTSAVLNTVSYKISMVVKIIVGFILLFLVYATNFEIDELARGNGKVIPIAKVKHIKHLEGGVVKEILVKEGDIVKRGQILIKIDPLSYISKYNENAIRIMQLKAKIARLDAEATGKELLRIECDTKCDEKVIQREMQLYRTDMKKLRKTISKLQEQIVSQESVLKDAKNKYSIAKENYLSLKDEYDIKSELMKKKVFYKYEIKNLKRDLNKLQSEMDSSAETIKQAKAKIKELQDTIEEVKATFSNKAASDHNDAVTEMLRLQETQKTLQDTIKRTVIRSPIDGTVNELFVHTVGTSIQPNSEVINIVPNSKELIAQVQVSPADIGKIHIGQHAELKITAFDYAIYGDLKGKIVNISPDTVLDPKDKKEYYQVYIKTRTNYIGGDKKYKIKVGMKVNANIIVGKKTIMSYLLKPILKSVQKG